MDDDAPGKLQIYSVEERGDVTATCVIRCVGGVVRTGQQFSIDPGVDGDTSLLTLDWINCYGQLADFIKPPYSGTVHLSGEEVDVLDRGVVLTSRLTAPPLI